MFRTIDVLSSFIVWFPLGFMFGYFATYRINSWVARRFVEQQLKRNNINEPLSTLLDRMIATQSANNDRKGSSPSDTQ